MLVPLCFFLAVICIPLRPQNVDKELFDIVVKDMPASAAERSIAQYYSVPEKHFHTFAAEPKQPPALFSLVFCVLIAVLFAALLFVVLVRFLALSN